MADIRRELRERLMAERTDGVEVVLGRLWALAERQPELVCEHSRWAVRFQLLLIG